MHYVMYISAYLALIGIYTLLCRFTNHFNGVLSLAYRVLLCLIIVVLSGIRCNFGSDYYTYYRMYNVVSDPIVTYGGILGFIENNLQVGFPFLMHVVRQFSDSPYAIFMVCAIIIYPSMFHWIYKRSSNETYSIALFFLLGLFDITNNVIKQSIALCALLYAFDALIERKYIRFSILSCIGILFHIASVFPIIAMLIAAFTKMKDYHILTLICISLVLLLLYDQLTTTITNIPVFERYTEYAEERVLSAPFVISSLAYTFLYIFVSFSFLRKASITRDEGIRVNLIILSIPFAILSLKYIVLLRLSYIALLQLVILIPKLEKNEAELTITRFRISKVLVIVVCFFIVTSLLAGNNRYYDYSTIYNAEPKGEWYR